MLYGWAGRILKIDLSRQKTVKAPLEKELAVNFLGARGVNAKILYSELAPGAHPLGDKNILIFGTGPLTGTFAPSCSRFTVTCKSPATGLYLKSTCGGHWAAELKYAGYDVIILYGKSDRPVYLWVDDEEVELRDASHLWGMDVRKTDRRIKKDVGDDQVKTVTIGPAGENLVRFASIMSCVYRAAGRGGTGAVMGSKGLKAIAIRGTGAVKVAYPESFRECVDYVRENKIIGDEGSHVRMDWETKHAYGTGRSVESINETGSFPVRNFQTSYTPQAHKISGQYLSKKGYLVGTEACFSCPMGCGRFTVVLEGPYSGTYCGGPEYETLNALGARCENYEMNTIIKANELCNIYGLDTISTGALIAFAMECHEKGILGRENTEGLVLEWGNGDAIVELVRKIAFREGLGDLLAEGVKVASERIGKGSERFAIQSKGLEQSEVETRATMAYALAFAVNPRGPDHLHAMPIIELLGYARPDLIKEITGTEEAVDPLSITAKAKLVKWNEEIITVSDALGLCTFVTGITYEFTPKEMAKMFSAATGIKITGNELLTAGERIINVEKAFNVREGASRRDDTLHERFFEEEIKSGPKKGLRLSRNKMDRMITDYYEHHGWDPKTGKPTRETLERLDLKEIAEDLEKIQSYLYKPLKRKTGKGK